MEMIKAPLICLLQALLPGHEVVLDDALDAVALALKVLRCWVMIGHRRLWLGHHLGWQKILSVLMEVILLLVLHELKFGWVALVLLQDNKDLGATHVLMLP